ncbi:MAG: hypothetical protein Q8M76_12510 [Spirochaetaceae bacterium]|nr:hypothetical protein [Spirochaetaceae bacterium]
MKTCLAGEKTPESRFMPEIDPAQVPRAAAALIARYGAWPDESSGPVLDQLVWFLLSTRTTVENCEAAYSALRAELPSWAAVAEAPEESLHAPLRPSGLFRSRARNLKSLLGILRERFGQVSLEALRGWQDAECEAFLLTLPGVGLKVARCVMSFGLGRRAFAVDAHIWRVTRRLGWHSFPGEAPTRAGADAIQELALLCDDPLSFHVDLIRLGRELCPSGEPDCPPCPLARQCAYARARKA